MVQLVKWTERVVLADRSPLLTATLRIVKRDALTSNVYDSSVKARERRVRARRPGASNFLCLRRE